MDINQLTIGQAKELIALFGINQDIKQVGGVMNATSESDQVQGIAAPVTLNRMIGQQVIIRTYSAGVWFGKLVEKAGNEVILGEARRMYKWSASESISLSAVALHGIKESESKIVQAVPSVWLEAIEIIPCSVKAAIQIAGAANVNAQ